MKVLIVIKEERYRESLAGSNGLNLGKQPMFEKVRLGRAGGDRNGSQELEGTKKNLHDMEFKRFDEG
tara:strand:- start:800 stop:1000 length:201 start_codon:yes stop_codon:yes gene_type:complete